MFARFFAPFRQKKQAYELYGRLVTQARSPVFYADLDVEDSIDGRFDMILLHLFIMDRRLEREGDKAARLRRQVQEAMIADMDRSLRELGVGDMSVGKEVKKMGAAWLGRLKAYAAAIATDRPQPSLAEAIAKNLYRMDDGPFAALMAEYALAAIQKLASVSLEDVIALKFDFPDVVVPKEKQNG